jgi:hypothetical protein
VQDRRASSEFPEAKRLLGALANSRGHSHEENAAKLVKMALEQPVQVGAALLASAEGYTPRATKMLEDARERLGDIHEVALALSENLPAPKQQPSRSRRRRRRKKKGATPEAAVQTESAAAADGDTAAPAPVPAPAAEPAGADGEGEAVPAADAETRPKRRRRRKKPAVAEDASGEDGAGARDDLVEAPAAD